MANKRKNDALDNQVSVPADVALAEVAPVKKKIRPDASNWQDIPLEGEDEGEVPIFDDCNEIRRKIRILQKTPGWKVTHWLRDIGGINNNSYSRFMKESGPTAGASNGLYYAAYVYFEKVRILEGKKKTEKRKKNEIYYYNGMPRENRTRVWVLAK